MKTNLKGVASNDLPFIQNELWSMIEAQAPELADCDEVIAIGRSNFIQRLSNLGNSKMLNRVQRKRHEYYLLMLYRKTMKLRVVPLPYEARSYEAELAA
jgi:hypothetical protein